MSKLCFRIILLQSTHLRFNGLQIKQRTITDQLNFASSQTRPPANYGANTYIRIDTRNEAGAAAQPAKVYEVHDS
jgi:hypothetical protein